MTIDVRSRPILALLPAVLLAGALAPWTAQAGRTTQLEVAQVFLELNDTDGDLGIHAMIDGGPWVTLDIEGPDGGDLLRIASGGMLTAQGLTQLMFESAEPSFDDLDPSDFLLRFPEGRYEIRATGQDGRSLAGRTRLSHVLAAPPSNVLVSGLPAAENCDADPLPAVISPVTIQWDPVTTSHPEIGRAGRVRVSRYQLFVENASVHLALDLPPDVTAFEIPPQVTAAGGEYKFEILVRTTEGNNTAVESCFVVK